ncbi:(2Fe-2S)-binding protein [Allokutzneria albata]|uniref:Ferric iron reductase protein FhuF, involved in iron transport n=1 Tax=Allokutzneria albata TaxID=211114 RepID=A0A1H0BLW2_ALLAB|nr:(2Fe-2S)-binding protein [Allokutzneria albata]SDN46592.1 Ferric iron reductase protein FhuF, involved in iron transport [Allokutzneria albata]
MRRFGEYFVIAVGAGLEAPTLREVYDGVGLGERVDDVCARLGTEERRVGASILFQGYTARVWSPLLGAVALGLPVPALPADEIHWATSGFTTAAPLPSATGTIAEIALDEHFAPMVSALRSEVAEGLLWGNAASSLVGTLKVIANAGELDQRTWDTAMDVLADPRLSAAGDFTDTGYRRRSCCLYYRVPNGGLCGDCSLNRA